MHGLKWNLRYQQRHNPVWLEERLLREHAATLRPPAPAAPSPCRQVVLGFALGVLTLIAVLLLW